MTATPAQVVNDMFALSRAYGRNDQSLAVTLLRAGLIIDALSKGEMVHIERYGPVHARLLEIGLQRSAWGANQHLVKSVNRARKWMEQLNSRVSQ